MISLTVVTLLTCHTGRDTAMARKINKATHQQQEQAALHQIRRIKQEAKQYIWALPPEEARKEAVLTPPPSELRRVPSRAWK
jgi:hypothetical protein